jgi:hypothetical protein
LRVLVLGSILGGGKRYTGLTRDISPAFDYCLPCGIPGESEGERYKKSLELVKRE